MRASSRLVAAAVAVVFTTFGTISGAAQGAAPLGSSTVLGAPDSVFAQFLAFLPTHGDSVLSSNPRKRQIEAHVGNTAESIIFSFSKKGDSTLVAAKGSKGGMQALISGVSAVADWADSRKAAKPDSAGQ